MYPMAHCHTIFMMREMIQNYHEKIAFGVVLAELLTRRKAVVSNESDEGLVASFQSSMKEKCLYEIIDELVVSEGQEEEILTAANLAMRYLKMNGKKRPSMKEVDADLDLRRRI